MTEPNIIIIRSSPLLLRKFLTRKSVRVDHSQVNFSPPFMYDVIVVMILCYYIMMARLHLHLEMIVYIWRNAF
ncbi:hypothetical protein HanXRQr2_Chr03g0135151 [Helianthus annuus]|uniref:Uncharacterized protein n=1 Tax=Helianthus annuus TaxID=4232 RepID=A0A251VD91_HELAN|nr:hypothetical protein HanXRQr2_Chr03g0135151 [Helianthus annuus]KAJ0945769.1 hypothetical protein HanPSC8_Chr03g0131811 [Helianthus annuus]